MRLLIAIIISCICNPVVLWANRLESAKTTVNLEAHSERILVRTTYLVKIDSGVRQIPLRAIGNSVDELQNIKGFVQDEQYSLNMTAVNAKVIKALVQLPLEFIADSLLEVAIEYELKGLALEEKYAQKTIPLIFVDWKPESASADVFKASIRVSKDYALKSIFPAMKWKREKQEPFDLYSFQLQTLPAWIKFKVYRGKPPFFSLEWLVDAGVILILFILLFAGWRKLSKNRAIRGQKSD